MSDVEELDKLAHSMFRQFSRMEYALKAAGHLERLDGDAKASWVSFGAEIDAGFRDLLLRDQKLSEAVAYLQQYPPKKQIVINGALGWSENPPTAPTQTGACYCMSGVSVIICFMAESSTAAGSIPAAAGNYFPGA